MKVMDMLKTQQLLTTLTNSSQFTSSASKNCQIYQNDFILVSLVAYQGNMQDLDMSMKEGIVGLTKNGYIVFFDEITGLWNDDKKISIEFRYLNFSNKKTSSCPIENEQFQTGYSLTLREVNSSQLLKASSKGNNAALAADTFLTLYFQDRDTHKQWHRALSPFMISDKLQYQYEVTKEIGKGHFSQVYQAGVLYESPYFGQYSHVAIKRIKKESSKEQNSDLPLIINEIQALRDLQDSKATIKILQIFESERRIYIVLEYINGGDLHAKYKQSRILNDLEKREMMKRLLEGLADIHSKGYIHRDLKPKNILLDNFSKIGSLKIADFGLTVNTSDSDWDQSLMCGTPGYIAPEIIKDSTYSDKCDIFSAGCILYQFIKGQQLLTGKDIRECLLRTKYFENSFLDYDNQLKEADKKFLKLLLNENHAQRITAREALKNEWFDFQEQAESMVLQCSKDIQSHIEEFGIPEQNQRQEIIFLEGIIQISAPDLPKPAEANPISQQNDIKEEQVVFEALQIPRLDLNEQSKPESLKPVHSQGDSCSLFSPIDDSLTDIYVSEEESDEIVTSMRQMKVQHSKMKSLLNQPCHKGGRTFI